MMKKLLLLFVAAMTMVLTSCSLNDDNDKNHFTVTYGYDDCFFQVTDLTDGSISYIKKPEVAVQYTYYYGDKVTCNAAIGIKGVPVSANETTYFEVNQMPVEITPKGTLLVSRDILTSKTDANLSLHQFRLEWNERTYGQQNIPVVQLSFTVNNRYKVNLIAKNYYLFGKTSVNAGEYTDKNTWYQVTIDPETMKASVFMHDARFAQKMPAMDLNVPGVGIRLSPPNYTIEGSSLIPEIEKKPMPSFEIETLRGDGTLSGNMTLRFNVKNLGNVTATLAPTYVDDEK